MKRLYGLGRWCGALGLLLLLLFAAHPASASAIKWWLPPGEIGDPDTPGGGGARVEPMPPELVVARLRVWIGSMIKTRSPQPRPQPICGSKGKR